MKEGTELADAIAARLAEQTRRDRAHGREARHDRMRAAIVSQLDAPAPRSMRGWQVGAAALALAAAVVLAWMWWPTAQTYRIEPGAPEQPSAAFVVAGDDEPVRVTFSGGSAVELRPRARLRVGERRDDGADLELGEGTIVATLEQPGSWRINAGPYELSALGTEVSVHWSPDGGRLDVEPIEGRVEIRGPGIDGTRVLDPGEALSLPKAVAVQTRAVDPVEAEPASDETPEVDDDLEPAAARVDDRALEGRTARPRRPSRPQREPVEAPPGEAPEDWRTLADAGKYRDAMTAAQALGLDALMGSLSARDLLELADVCRYAGKARRAREVLTTLRRRFPGTDAAAAAAFDLGRLVAGKGGETCEASVRWFRTYLTERPGGSMAAAAAERIEECKSAEVGTDR